jgi:hypothetical protein
MLYTFTYLLTTHNEHGGQAKKTQDCLLHDVYYKVFPFALKLKIIVSFKARVGLFFEIEIKINFVAGM